MKENQILESKKIIRKQFLEKRKQIPKEIRTEKSKQILEKIISLPELSKVKKIMIYCSFGSEVQTKELIKQLRERKKKVFVPLITNKEKCLMTCIDTNRKTIKPEELHLIIIPGITFDLKGNRLGWGKACHDKNTVKVWGEFSITFPLLVAGGFKL